MFPGCPQILPYFSRMPALCLRTLPRFSQTFLWCPPTHLMCLQTLPAVCERFSNVRKQVLCFCTGTFLMFTYTSMVSPGTSLVFADSLLMFAGIYMVSVDTSFVSADTS